MTPEFSAQTAFAGLLRVHSPEVRHHIRVARLQWWPRAGCSQCIWMQLKCTSRVSTNVHEATDSTGGSREAKAGHSEGGPVPGKEPGLHDPKQISKTSKNSQLKAVCSGVYEGEQGMLHLKTSWLYLYKLLHLDRCYVSFMD